MIATKVSFKITKNSNSHENKYVITIIMIMKGKNR